MASQLGKDIERFANYFRKQLCEIQAMKTDSAELYQRLLYLTLLDTLSGIAFPDAKNRDRYISFIKKFCEWSDGDRVSLPHLAQLLQMVSDPEYKKVHEWTINKLETHPVHGGTIEEISYDPSFEEVKAHWPNNELNIELEGKKIWIEQLQHFNLLYAYRNTLVHEFRIPGYGIEIDDTPYYHLLRHSNANGDDIPSTIELVYPHQFLFQLCDSGLKQLVLNFTNNGINPYDSRKFGTYWINELNR